MSNTFTVDKLRVGNINGSTIFAAVQANTPTATKAGDLWIDLTDNVLKISTASGTSNWELASAGTLSDLTDMQIESAADGNILVYDSGLWKNIAEVSNGGLSQTALGIELDLSNLNSVAIDVANDSIAILDASDSSTKLESIADVVTGVAGTAASTSLSASSGVLSVKVDDTTIERAATTGNLQVKANSINATHLDETADYSFTGNNSFGTGTLSLNNGATIADTKKISYTQSQSFTTFDLITKEYADAVAAGFGPKASVKAASNTKLSSEATISADTTFNAGTLSPFVATTITATLATSGVFSLDGVSLSAGDRILVKNEQDSGGLGGAANGIYTVEISGTSLTLTRSDDANDTPSDGEIKVGTYTFVESGGTSNGNTGWSVVTYAGTINTSPIIWSQFSGGVSGLTEGALIDFSGSTVAVDLTELSALTGPIVKTEDSLVVLDNGTVQNKYSVDSLLTDMNLNVTSAAEFGSVKLYNDTTYTGSLDITSSVTLSDNRTLTLDLVNASSTLKVEANSVVNQDLSSDANPEFATIKLYNDSTYTGSLDITSSVTLDANKTLTLDLVNASSTLKVDGNVELKPIVYSNATYVDTPITNAAGAYNTVEWTVTIKRSTTAIYVAKVLATMINSSTDYSVSNILSVGTWATIPTITVSGSALTLSVTAVADDVIDIKREVIL